MTCYDMIKYITQFEILASIDFVEGVLCVLCCVIMMIHFFGIEGSVTKKAIIQLLIFMFVGIALFTFCNIIDYHTLIKIKDEPYTDSIHLHSFDIKYVYVGRVMYYTNIIITGFLCFKKKRIINAIMLLVSTVIFVEYVMLLTSYAISYIWEDPREVVFEIIHIGLDKNLQVGTIVILTTLFLEIVILSALYFGVVRKKRTMYIAWKYRIAFLIWEISLFVIHLWPYSPNLSHSEHVNYMAYELGVLVPIVGLIIPIVIVTAISRRYAIEKTKVQENYISAELDYLRQYKKDQNETRAFRHDIINNLSMLSTMYAEGKYDEAREHLSDLLGDIRAMSPKYITGDEMLDCIVGMKISKMEEEGIKFSLEGVIDGGLDMKPVDICTIFANAIDNAIEACEKISGDCEKWIKLSIKRTDKFFSINLSNSMVDDKKIDIVHKLFGDDKRVTTKKDKSLHGYGTKNMKAAISKYEGIEKVNAEDGVFTLSILFPRTI